MSKYFGEYPTVAYKTDRNYDLATNIMVRIKVLVQSLDRVFHYYDYVVKDGETPEMLAEKLYGDPEAHWLILLTNNITNYYDDWVKSQPVFNQYIVDKYGSYENAASKIKQYFEVYKTVETSSGTISYSKYELEAEQYPANIAILDGGTGFSNTSDWTVDSNGTIISIQSLDSKFLANSYYTLESANGSNANLWITVANTDWSTLPTDPGSFISTDKAEIYTPYRETQTYFDWEHELNEQKRNIKIIRPEYYTQIRTQFLALIGSDTLTAGIRTIS